MSTRGSRPMVEAERTPLSLLHPCRCAPQYACTGMLSSLHTEPRTIHIPFTLTRPERRQTLMGTTFFGVPLLVWGGVCLALALVWVVIWPSKRIAHTSGVRFFILRWFHALTWLFLALAAFMSSFNILGGASTARVVAQLSLATYLIFIGAVVTSSARH